jgi:hypothetical protein
MPGFLSRCFEAFAGGKEEAELIALKSNDVSPLILKVERARHIVLCCASACVRGLCHPLKTF